MTAKLTLIPPPKFQHLAVKCRPRALVAGLWRLLLPTALLDRGQNGTARVGPAGHDGTSPERPALQPSISPLLQGLLSRDSGHQP